MATAAMNFIRASFLSAALLVLAGPAQAGNPAATDKFYSQIFEIMGQNRAENARDKAGKCAASGEQIKDIQGLTEPERLDLEALVEQCIFIEMNLGEFSDKTGDQCSHHYAFVKKLAAAAESWMKEPNSGGQDMTRRASDLESKIHNGELVGCKNDYKVFNGTIAAAKAQKR